LDDKLFNFEKLKNYIIKFVIQNRVTHHKIMETKRGLREKSNNNLASLR